MKNAYPIGTALTFIWRFIAPDNKPFLLDEETQTLRLRYFSGRGVMDVDDFIVNAAKDGITWTMTADEEFFAGKYSLVLDITEGERPIGQFYYKDAFTLYQGSRNMVHSQQSEVSLLSVGEFYLFSPEGVRGKSAYEIALEHGYTGTEEEWLNDPVNGIKGNGIDETIINQSTAQSGVTTIKFKYANGDEKTFEVPNGTGIVAVTETASQEDSGVNDWTIQLSNGEEKHFSVKNGRGIKSVEQTTVGVGSGAQNVVTITLSDNTTETFTFTNGAKGDKGDSGYTGAAEELAVVNDLDGGGEDGDEKALSALQGFVLGQRTEVAAPVNDKYLSESFEKNVIVPTAGTLPLERYAVLDTGKYGTSTTNKHLRVDVSPGDLLYIKTGDEATRVVFLTSAEAAVSGADMPAVTDGIIELAAEKEYMLEVPTGTIIAAIYDGADGAKRPSNVIVYNKKQQPAPYREIKSIPCGHYYGIEPESTTGSLAYSSSFAGNICFKVRAGKKYVARSASFLGTSECRVGLLENLPFVGCQFTGGSVKSKNVDGFYNGEPVAYWYEASTDGYLLLSAFNRDVTIYEIGDTATPFESELKGEVESVRANDTYTEVNLDDLPERANIISPFSCFRNANGRHRLVPVSFGQRVKIVPHPDRTSYIAFLKDNFTTIEKGAHASERLPYVRKPITTTEILTVPDDAKYLFVSINVGSSYNYRPDYIGLSLPPASISSEEGAYKSRVSRDMAEETSRGAIVPLTEKTILADANGWEIPHTIQQEMFVKKVLQLANIEWTPKSDVPGDHFTKEGGTTYIGIPYGNNMQFYKLVGISVSLESFMTAVNNPYSLLYTEKVKNTSSRSIWGRVYHNSNGWSYYGSACNSFAVAVLGAGDFFGNRQIKLLNFKSQTFVPVCAPMSVDYNLIEIGDIINNGSHCFLILGIKRDGNGEVLTVKTAEEFPYEGYDCPRIRNCSRAYFSSLIGQSDESQPGVPEELGEYPKIISRYAYLFKNTDYKPSPFVQNEGETAEEFEYNNDICTFAGDKVSFGDGELVVLNYNLTATPSHNWTAIEVYKDDELLQTYSLASIVQSELPEGQRNHALNLGTTLAAGQYKARLTDGENYSDYTYWEVLKAAPVVTRRSDGGYDVECDVPVSAALLGYMREENNDEYFHYQLVHHLSYEELATWKLTMYPAQELADFQYSPEGAVCVRLILIGVYGKALSSVITLVQ